jgi:non-specific serine/threonine protein kinase
VALRDADGSAAAGGGARSGTAAPARAPAADSPLSRREGEVAGLIAQGLSNRAIAESLVLSVRTVDGHVERILAKLGFGSRAQVAAWVADHAR